MQRDERYYFQPKIEGLSLTMQRDEKKKQKLNLNYKAFQRPHQSFSSGWWTWGTGVGVKVGGGSSTTSLD